MCEYDMPVIGWMVSSGCRPVCIVVLNVCRLGWFCELRLCFAPVCVFMLLMVRCMCALYATCWCWCWVCEMTETTTTSATTSTLDVER